MPTLLEPSTTKRTVTTAGKYCPICGGRGSEGVPVECCGVRLTWQWDSVDEYDSWYADPTAYHVDEQTCQGQRAYEDSIRYASALKAADVRLKWISAATGKTDSLTIIDVGAGNMAFVDRAIIQDHAGFGIDPNPMDDYCLRGSWKDVQGEWDVITLHDVFEHLTDPRGCLRHLKSCLRPKGTLVIEMPEWNSPLHKAQGDDFRHIRPRQHIALYSKDAAERLFADEGLTVTAFYRPLRGAIGKASWFLMRDEHVIGAEQCRME